jgi:ribosomal protein S18 acetylase RimI-like enzyme
VSVRAAVVDDAAAIADIHIRSWQAAYQDVLDPAYLAGLSDNYDRRVVGWSRIIEEAGASTVVLVVEDGDGTVAGFVHCSLPDDEEAGEYSEGTAELNAIYLDPQVYRHGYGTALWIEARSRLEKLGFDTAVLWVLEENPPARAFYEKHGWALDGGYQTECMGLPAAAVRYRVELG